MGVRLRKALSSLPPPPPPPPEPGGLASSLHLEKQRITQLGVAAQGASQQEGPEDIFQILRTHGPRSGLTRAWDKLEALQGDAKFSCAQIAEIFSLCTPMTTLGNGQRFDFVGPLPLSVRLVQLFSNFVCENIPALTPQQITVFVTALTSARRPMD